MRKTRADLNIQEVIDKIAEYQGNVSAVARFYGLSRETLYKYIREKATVKKALEDARETMLDNAESSLYRAVINGEAWATCFFLKTQGRKRGYVERQEIAGVAGQPIPFKVVYADPLDNDE